VSGGSPTIITKVLLPSKRPALIHRPRLVDFVHENINRKLIIVSAGAGYGKTSLLIDYAHDTDLPVCWLALDEGDRDLRVFLDYVLSAIRHKFPQFGQRTQETLQSASFPIDIKAIVGALATDIYEEIPGYFVLILDDYHLVDESLEVNLFLDALLRHQPENCHIILASRTLPAKLTITRLVARQEVAGLGVAEMRFTAGEIQELMRQNYQVELSHAQADELAQRSEGWITGILLTSHDLWGGLFKNMIRIQGDEGQIFDYLATEVFAQQSPAVQDFLVFSSVLDRMNATLCDALLGTRGADELLRSLEQRNLFIFRLEDNWYRYHHLFRSFLAAKGRAQDADKYLALHVRAGHLFADQGLWSEAIEHYIRAAAWDEAAQAIGVAAGDAFDRGQWTTLSRWIDSLPLDLLRQQPQSLFHRGKLYMDTGNSDAAISFFDRARVEYARQGDQAGVAKTLVEEGVIHYCRGETPKAIENARRALTILGENGATAIVGRAHRGLGTSFILQGDFNGAASELQKALAIYERLDRTYDIAITHHDLGVAHERTGNLTLSAFHYQQALRYWHRVNNPGGTANTLNSLGVIQHYQGNYHEALETLEDALQKAKEANAPRAEAYALASLGDLNRDLRNLDAALQSYEAALEIGKRKDEAFIITYALLGIGNLYCDQNKLEVARYYIEQAAENAHRHHSRYETALCQLSTGILLYILGDLKASQQSLAQAAEAFRADGAKREQARTLLHLAQAALLGQQSQEVEKHLRTVADLARELQSTQFAVAEGYNLSQLLKYGATHRIGDGLFREVVAQLRSLSSAKPASVSDKASGSRSVAVKSLEIYAFGNSQVIRDGRIISSSEWDATITKEMFFFLLSQSQGLRKEEIIVALWGDLSASKGNSNFHSTAYRLRKALYPECLIHESGVYRLALEVQYSYDVAEFLELLAEAKANPKNQEESYRKAIALYKGDFLVDIYADWAAETREQLCDEYLHALTALSAHYAQKGDYEESIALAKKALAHDGFQEAVYRQLMQYYALAGNRAAAVKCYQECSQLFKSEFNAEPTLETMALYQQILNGLWDRPQA
jgi:ATP/maltotriose-dependent transcriptional regulator MalT/DNA-binding SARP family transcriptional activator